MKYSRIHNWLPSLLGYLTIGWLASQCCRAGAQTTYALTNAWYAAANTQSATNIIVTGDQNRSVAYDSQSNQVLIVNHGIPAIEVMDAPSGSFIGLMNVSLATAGIFKLDQVAVAADGAIYAGNLQSAVSSSSPFNLYRWQNWNDPSPLNVYSGDPHTAGGVTAAGARIGDTLAITGSGTNTLILAALLSGTSQTTNMVLFHTLDGTNFTATLLAITGLPGLGTGVTFGYSFYTNNTFLIRANGNVANPLTLVSFPANFASLASPVLATAIATNGFSVPNIYATLDYKPQSGLLAALGIAINAPGTSPVCLYSNPFGSNGPVQLAITNYVHATPNGNAAGAVTLGGTGYSQWVFSVDCNNGVNASGITVSGGQLAGFPQITSQPASQLVSAGGTAAFQVTATGTAPLSYQWQFNNTNLVDGGGISGSQSNVLTIANSNTNAAGNYQVIVTNSYGATTSTVAVLTIQLSSAPSITSQPVSQTVSLGSTAAFQVTATGTAPLTYQWAFDNTNLVDSTGISGSQTSQLTITGVSSNNAGSYSVIVSNALGHATSQLAALTLLPANSVAWTNTTGGNWSVAANWSPHIVPGANNNVFIVANGSYTVNLDVNATVGSLTVGGAGGQQTFATSGTSLAINGVGSFGTNAVFNLGGNLTAAITLSGGGVMNWNAGNVTGSLTVASNGVLNISWNTLTWLYGALTNAGLVNVTGTGQLNASGGPIENLAGGTFNFQTDQNWTGFPITFYNAGLLRKSGGTGTTAIGYSGGGYPIYFQNTGTVEADTGTIGFYYGGQINGNYLTAGNAVIDFGAGAFTVGNPAITGQGTTRFDGTTIALPTGLIPNLAMTGGTLIPGPGFQGGTVTNLPFPGIVLGGTNTVSGTVTLAGFSGSLAVTNGGLVNLQTGNSQGPLTVAGGGTVNCNGNVLNGAITVAGGALMNWNAGNVTGSFTVSSNGELNINWNTLTYLTGALTNSGLVNVTGTGQLNAVNGPIQNLAGGVFDFQTDQNWTGFPITFYNAGTLRKSGGTGVTAIGYPYGGYPINLLNTGTISVNSGTLEITSTFSNAPTSVFNFSIRGTGAGVNYGQLDVLGTFPLTGALNLNFTNGYNPQPGDSFRIINWGGAQGAFSTTNVSGLGTGLSLQGVVTNSGLTMVTLAAALPAGFPQITNQPASLTVITGAMAAFNVGVSGTAPLTYQWFLNGTNLSDNGRITGSQSNILTIANASTNDAGNYQVTVTNLAGATNSTVAVLTVQVPSPPTITSQPVSQTVGPGSTAIFQVSATGTTPMFYQWQFNNSNLVDGGSVGGSQTSQLSIGNVSSNNVGNYSVIVSNSAGTAISQLAALSLLPPNSVVWTNTAGGNWSVAANWSPNFVPGATNNVFIINNGTYTVILDVSASVNNLTVGGSSGRQTFSISASTLTLNGIGSFSSNTIVNLYGGLLNGLGTLTINGTFNWTGGQLDDSGVMILAPGSVANISSGPVYWHYRTVNNYGTMIWTGGGQIYAGLGAVLNNEAGGLFDIQCDSGLGGTAGPVTFNNFGTLRKTAGSGTTSLGGAFNNNGTVQVQSGSLVVNNGNSTGAFTVAAGANLTFGYPSVHTLGSSASISGAGSVTSQADLTNNGSYNISGSTTISALTTVLNGPVVNLGANVTLGGAGAGGTLYLTPNFTNNGTVTLSDGGGLGGDGSLTLNGTLNWIGDAGSLFGSGVTTFGAGSVVNLNGNRLFLSQRTVNNYGTVNWIAGGIIGELGPVFNNQAGALFNVQYDDSFGPVTINNAGMFSKTAGSGVTTMAGSFNNNGTVQVQSGSLVVDNGNSTGAFTVAAGANLAFGYPSVHTLGSSASISGAGSVTSQADLTNNGSYNISGSTTISALTTVLNGPVVNLGANVTLGGAGAGGTLYLTPNFTNNGTVTLSDGGGLGGDGSLTLNGTLNWIGDAGSLFGSGVTTFGAGSVVNLNGNRLFLSQRTVNNHGTVNWIAGDIFGQLAPVFNNQAGALFNVQCDNGFGLETINNAGTFRKTAGGGTTSLGGTFNNNGTVQINSGVLELNGVFSNTPSSSFTFPLGGTTLGTGYGQLAVAGNFPLAGSFNVSLTNGYVPNVGDSFRVITWGSKSGGFSAANGLDLGKGVYFQGQPDRSGLSLVVKTSVAPTPPPATNLASQVVALGDTAVFSFSPLGVPPFTYQWSFDGTNLPGQTNALLALPNVQAGSLGDYCVTVADALNNTNTYCADLSAISVPGFSSQPHGLTSPNGANLTLTAGGIGSAPLSYQWRLNGENITGATNATYVITNAQPVNGGLYSVLVANPVRVIGSTNAEVLILTNALPFADNFASAGVINSLSGVGSGNNTNATHEAGEPDHDGKPGSHSVWLRWTAPASGVATFNTRGSDFDTLVGVYIATNGTPSVTNLTAVTGDDDSADYFTSLAAFNAVAGTNYYIAVDGLNTASGDIVLTWNLITNVSTIPMIVLQPQPVTSGLGGTAGFSVFAASTTTLFYQWYLDDWLAVGGATNASLTIADVSDVDLGNYSVEITSGDGQVVDSLEAPLEIGPGGNSYDKLEDLLNNFAGLGTPGGHVKPHTSSGGFPSVSVGTIGSQLINNFNSTTEEGEPVAAVVGGASRWYLLTAATNATLEIDTLGSDIATLLAVYTGGNIFSLSVVATNVNGAPDGVRSEVKFPAKTGTNYLVSVDGVNGAQGSINLNWRMGVPPNGVAAAQSLTLTNNANLVLKSGVTNNATAPNYQWQQNGVNLAGATNATFTLTSLQSSQVGSYSVLVSNLVGAVVNSIATVTAQTPLQLLPGGKGFQVSGSATQAVVLQLSTNLTVWTPLYTNTSPLLPITYTDTNSPKRTRGFYKTKPWP